MQKEEQEKIYSYAIKVKVVCCEHKEGEFIFVGATADSCEYGSTGGSIYSSAGTPYNTGSTFDLCEYGSTGGSNGSMFG